MYLSPASDPDADTVVTKEQLEGFEVRSDVPKIPAALWQAWVDLCVEMTKRDSRNLEVSCRLLRNEADPTLYRIAVPEQSVTVASVRVDSFDKAVDLMTGEVIIQWPPEGWRPCGSSHSHNTMDSFFSGTDDAYELGDPGLHIVVGNIDVAANTHTLVASITAQKRRFIIDEKSVLDDVATVSSTFHPAVLDVIKLPVADISSSYTSYSFPAWGSRTYNTTQIDTPPRTDYRELSGVIQTFNDQLDVTLDTGKQLNFENLQVLEKLRDEIEARIEDQYFFSSPMTAYSDPYAFNSYAPYTY
jgi:hypothetical protein